MLTILLVGIAGVAVGTVIASLAPEDMKDRIKEIKNQFLDSLKS